MSQHIRIAICGAGPVGQALALMLRQQGVSAHELLLFDGKSSEQARQDARSIALSYGSRQILQKLGAWPIKATSITQIHVSRRGHFGRSLIDAADYALPALGYVARYGDIIAPLEQLLTQQRITIQRPAIVENINEQVDHVKLTMQDGTNISADLVIQAEGGFFDQQPEGSQHRDYQQTAIVAHITTSKPIAARAFERFTDQGPLALLPQEDGYALVWCTRPATAAGLLALDDKAFLQALQQAFGERLGTIRTTSTRHSYPLGLNAQAKATARTVKIGNAAQTLHPVAGQGLNLGLRDALILAKCLTSQPQSTALATFNQQRQSDRKATISITDSMARAFASAPDGALSQALLGLGLGALDIVTPAKKLLAEQMMFGWR
jgi:2-octaprenyl-6-methoxyphenol hydroxylase